MVYPHSYRTEHSETKTSNCMYGEHYLATQSNKIKIQPPLLKIIQLIDSSRERYQENLAKAIKIKSIPTDVQYRDEIKKMTKFLEDWLKKLDMKYEVFNIGSYQIEGKKLRLPPVILASLGNDPNKKTLCAYAHVDVPDPKFSKWDTDPWFLTVKNNDFYGNGTGCGKGPLMCWFHVIQAFKFNKMPLPVNFRLCIEMMHHQNSQGFSAFVATKKQEFFNQVDFVAQIDGEWLGPKIPCILYGTVGVLHMELTIEGDSSDSIKKDMKNIFDTIANDKLEILIPRYSDMVEQIGPDEERVYERIREFDPEEIRESLPPHKRDWDKVRILMHFWRLPSIFIDEIEECKCQNRDKKMVRRHFVLKIIPKQTVDRTVEMIQEHVNAVIKEKNIKNKVHVKLVSSVRPWLEKHNSFNFQCARRAFIQIYKQDPSLIREDRGRETAAIFDSVLEKNLVILPVCSKGSNQAEGNEKISARCYYEATKLLAAYMFQLAQSPKGEGA